MTHMRYTILTSSLIIWFFTSAIACFAYFHNREQETSTFKPENESELDAKIVQNWKIDTMGGSYANTRSRILETDYTKKVVDPYYYDGGIVFFGSVSVLSLLTAIFTALLIFLEKIGITSYYSAKTKYYTTKMLTERKTLDDLIALQKKISED